MSSKNRVSIKKSSVAGKIPQPADLVTGELAVNFADKKLFTKDAADQVVALLGKTGPQGPVGLQGPQGLGGAQGI